MDHECLTQEMLVVHVFQARKIKDNNQGTRDRDIVIASLRR